MTPEKWNAQHNPGAPDAPAGHTNWLTISAVVLALLFGVLRPALRQISGPPKNNNDPAIGEDPLHANVQVVEDEDGLPVLGEDQLQLGGAAAPLALPLDAYEERLRLAREAVKADSKRVAQVVRGWVAND